MGSSAWLVIAAVAVVAAAGGAYVLTNGSGDDSPAEETAVVTFFNESEKSCSNVVVGEKVKQPSDPIVPEGYTFMGWYSNMNDLGTEFDFTKPVTGNITLYAVIAQVPDGFMPAQTDHIIQFKYNIDGPAMDYSIVPYDHAAPFPEPADVPGYDFIGWFTDTTYSEKFNEELPIRSDTVVYGYYFETVYEVNFLKPDGSILETHYYKESQDVVPPENPVMAPTNEYVYTFTGWDKDIVSPATGDAEYTAIFSQNDRLYTITIKSSNPEAGMVSSGSVDGLKYGTSIAVDEDKIAIGSTEIQASVIEKTGYDNAFKGWTVTDGQLVQENFEIVATFDTKAIDYPIHYYSEGGDHSNPAAYTVASPTIVLQSATKTGFKFDGWFTELEHTNKVLSIPKGSIGELELFASFIPTTYTITYVGMGDASSNPTQYNCTSDTISLMPAEMDGYSFDGWFTDSGYTSQITQIESGTYGNLILYAKHSPISHTVTFYNGEQYLGDIQVKHGTNIYQSILPENAQSIADLKLEKTGTLWAGWAAGDESSCFIAHKVLDDTSLHAVFNTAVTVRFHPNVFDEEFSATAEGNTVTVAEGKVFQDSELNTHRSTQNWEHIGWFVDSDLTTEWDRVVTEDLTDVYAKWQSKWAPYYDPVLVDNTPILLGSDMDLNTGYKSYLYYIGTAKDVLIDERARIWAGDSTTLTESESEVRTETVTKSVIKTVETGKSSTETTTTAITKNNSSVDGAGVAGGILGMASNVMSAFKKIPTPVTAAVGVAGDVCGVISALMGAPTESEETSTKTNSVETWEMLSRSEGIENAVAVARGNTLSISERMTQANPGDIVILGTLATVEYLQLVTFDANGEKVYECITYNTYNAHNATVSIEYHGLKNDMEAYADSFLSRKIIEPMETTLDESEENLQNPEADMQAFLDESGVLGSGTSDDPYLVKDEKGLLVMRMRTGACYKLVSDIDLSGNTHWAPFEFRGEIIGNGMTISGLSLSSYDSSYMFGLFSNFGGSARDLNISGFHMEFTGGQANTKGVETSMGAFAARLLPNTTISNVDICDCTLHTNSAIVGIGAVAHFADNGCSIQFCDISGCKLGDMGDIGGIVGSAHSSTITNCTVSNTTISQKPQNGPWCLSTGGITGYLLNSDIYSCSVTDNTVFNLEGTDGVYASHYMGYIVGSSSGSCKVSGVSMDGTSTFKESSEHPYNGDRDTVPPENIGWAYAGWAWNGKIHDGTTEYVENGRTYWCYNYGFAIHNSEDLKRINDHTDRKYILKNDIALSGNWTPLSRLSGTLDGCNHKITGLKYDGTVGTKYDSVVRYGLFDSTDNATICNLTVDGAEIFVKDSKVEVRVGAITANAYGYTLIRDCKVVDSTIKTSSGGASGYALVGGIAGLLENNSEVYRCTAENLTVNAYCKKAFAGGITGGMMSESEVWICTVQNCNIVAKGHSSWRDGEGYAGGVCGQVYSKSTFCGGNQVNDTKYDGCCYDCFGHSDEGMYIGKYPSR